VQPKKADTGIFQNTILVVTEEATVFKSPESADEVSTLSEGSLLVASGPPVEVDGFDMVPLQPCGSVELRVVRLMVPLEASVSANVEEVQPAPKQVPLADMKKASIVAKAKAEEEDLDGLLSEFGVVLEPVTKTSKKKGKR